MANTETDEYGWHMDGEPARYTLSTRCGGPVRISDESGREYREEIPGEDHVFFFFGRWQIELVRREGIRAIYLQCPLPARLPEERLSVSFDEKQDVTLAPRGGTAEQVFRETARLLITPGQSIRTDSDAPSAPDPLTKISVPPEDGGGAAREPLAELAALREQYRQLEHRYMEQERALEQAGRNLDAQRRRTEELEKRLEEILSGSCPTGREPE